MATISGTQGYWKVWLSVVESDTSIADNTSSAKWELWLGRTYESTSYIAGTPTININVSGKSAYSDSPYLNISGITQNGVMILSGTVNNIEHDSSGNVISNAISFTWRGSGFNPSNVSASGTYTTSTIPRATPAPKFTATIGTPMNITISPKATDTFYHRIHLTIGGTGYWLKSDGSITTNWDDYYTFGKTVTSMKFNTPTSLYQNFTGKSTTGTIKVYTYKRLSNLTGGYTYSQIGSTTSNTFTLNCDATKCTPTISATVFDTNEKTLNLTGNENNIVANASHATITPIIESVSDIDDIDTTIQSMYIDGVQFTGETVTIANPTKKSFTLRVINSRGYPVEYTASASGDLIPYTPLTFNIISLKRPEPTTGEVAIKYDGNYFNKSFSNGVNNYLSLAWTYRETNANDWSNTVNLSTNIDYNNQILTSTIPDSFGKTFLEEWDGQTTMHVFAANEKYSLQTVVSSSGSFVWVTLTNLVENTRQTIYRYIVTTNIDGGEVQENNITLTLPSDLGVFTTLNTGDRLYNYLKVGGILYLNEYTIDSNTYNGEESLGTLFDYTKVYDFVFYARDLLTELEYTATVSRGLPVFWWNADGFHIIGNLYVTGEINPSD